ncbi:MAG: CaiB/BaiF CoA transferase family protein [Haloarculaceae archaeon]
MSGPLDGLSILDLSGIISGGFATAQLADYGADVVTVEHPDHEDPVRDWPPKVEGTSLWWKSLGRNRRCITLDLSTDEGREIALDLAAAADAVIENFRPGTLERWGLGYDDLREANEELVLVRISGYGQTGPKADRPGFGTVAEAISTFANRNGWPDRRPLLPPVSLADMVAGLFAVQSLLAALYERDRSGEGQVVDVSLYEALFRLFPGDVERYDRLGEVSERRGNHHPSAAPRNVYETADGYVALSASAPSIFANLAAAIGRPDLTEDERFATNAARVEHADELDAVIEDWTRERTTEEALDQLEAGGAVVAPVYDMSDVFEDEQYAARDDIVSVDDPDVGPLKTANTVPKFSRTDGEVDHLGPRHGEHTAEVLGEELGLSRDRLAELRERDVI